jgi:hypothetical protein
LRFNVGALELFGLGLFFPFESILYPSALLQVTVLVPGGVAWDIKIIIINDAMKK